MQTLQRSEPVEIAALSRIGFGGYRINDTAEHYQTLLHALRSGCNLIDTASTYTKGESEKLVGKVLKDHPDLPHFIITKAGYANDHALLQSLIAKGMPSSAVVTFPPDYRHCIHPDYLKVQFETSLHRLGKESIDCFMIHNPEYYFKDTVCTSSSEEFYSRIKESFAFLEDLVSQGKLRYYGISSNTFPFAVMAAGTTRLNNVIAAAKSVASNHHFRMIQFPFNYFEQQALDEHESGESLIAIAKANNIICLSNRPFNTRTVPLLSFKEDFSGLELQQDKAYFDSLAALAQRKLIAMKREEQIFDFTIFAQLKDNWYRLYSLPAIDNLFSQQLTPFLETLSGGDLLEADRKVLQDFHAIMSRYTRKNITDNVANIVRKLKQDGYLRNSMDAYSNRAFCEYYLERGIDHVLVGMRKPDYVDSLKESFRR